jgi:hypothetical protein
LPPGPQDTSGIVDLLRQQLLAQNIDPNSPEGIAQIAGTLQQVRNAPPPGSRLSQLGPQDAVGLGAVPPGASRPGPLQQAAQGVRQAVPGMDASMRGADALFGAGQRPAQASLPPQAGPSPLANAERARAQQVAQGGPSAIQQATPDRFGLDVAVPAPTRARTLSGGRKRLAWMDDPQQVSQVVASAASKLRFDPSDRKARGKKRGRYIPFESLPQDFQNGYMEAMGDAVQEFGVPAGLHTSDLNKRQRQLITRMSGFSAQEKKKKRRRPKQTSLVSTAPSGPAQQRLDDPLSQF